MIPDKRDLFLSSVALADYMSHSDIPVPRVFRLFSANSLVYASVWCRVSTKFLVRSRRNSVLQESLILSHTH